MVFHKAIQKAPITEIVDERIINLIDCITYSIYVYTTRGLFESDKLIFVSQMTFQVRINSTPELIVYKRIDNIIRFFVQILLMKEEISPQELDFFLRFPIMPHVTSPVDFLSDSSWGGVRSLSTRDDFRYNLNFSILLFITQQIFMFDYRNLDRDIESSSKRWKKFIESECPEHEKFPQEWKSKTSLQRLMMMRALRPDRMTYAMM